MTSPLIRQEIQPITADIRHHNELSIDVKVVLIIGVF